MRSHFLRAAQTDSGPASPFTLIGSSTVGTATSGGTITATIPAGRMAGDFILVVHAARSSADLNMSLTDPAYTKIADLYANDTVDSNLGVHWKISNGTEAALSLPGGAGFTNATCSVQVWRGVDLVSPLDVTPTTATGIDAGIAVNPPITTVTDGALVLVAASVMTGTSAAVVTQPSGFADLTVATTPGGSIITRASVASKLTASAGLVLGGSWSASGGDSALYSWCACTLAIRPA
jgi:hypothetical protein